MAVTTALLYSRNTVNKLLFHIRLLFLSKEDKELFTFLYKTIGLCPKNLDLYKRCFTHRSSSKALKSGSNERLEFLGDAILDSIVAGYLFETYPDAKEGNLTEMRSNIVKRKRLNDIAIEMKLQKHIWARIPNLKQNDAMGNCLEAFIGTMYKDLGYRKTKNYVISKIILPHINKETLPIINTNYKSKLYQYVQKKKLELQLVSEPISQSNRQAFKAEIFINNEKISEGVGRSKKDAEQLASKNAMKILQV